MNMLIGKISGTLAGLTLLAASALPLSAQEASTMQTEASVEHAQIGQLLTVDHNLGRISVIPQTHGIARWVNLSDVSRSFSVDTRTPVQGLGSIMQVGELTPSLTGDLVRVTYKDVNGHDIAQRIDFLSTPQIRLTAGTVSNINVRRRTFDLENVEGKTQHMTLDVGVGGLVDSPTGLMPFSALKDGQRVEVYFAPRMDNSTSSGSAYLVIRTDAALPISQSERSAG